MIKNLKESKGITLIALVITIIVLLILAGVAISMLSGENGILNQATNAKQKTEEESVRESIRLAVLSARTLKNGSLTKENLENELKSYFGEDGFTVEETQSEDGTKTVYKVTVGEVEEIVEDSKGSTGVEVTIGGEKVTPENVAGYLGKKVTNYTGKTSVQIGSETYDVSPEYRLYYIDFDGKYGEKGTIYLKAECTSDGYSLPTTETTPENPKKTDAIKIRALNPVLYEDEKGEAKTPPTARYDNMKAVTWLTDSTKWSGLKPETYSNGITDQDINYIVGAPSLEMMMDSYNTHYGLSGDTPKTGDLNQDSDGERAKLFYQYNQGASGYEVGPSGSYPWSSTSSNYSIKTDGEKGIDTMYYPGSDQCYWLASPSSGSSDYVKYVNYDYGGYVAGADYCNEYAFCPLVSLKSSVQLELE